MANIPIHNNVLLLQGPIGSFFCRLARHMKSRGSNVYKINFHGGDSIFYRGDGVTPFRGSFSEWESFVREFICKNDVEAIYLFGDCREYHKVAIGVARELNINVYVFEEGYVRPSYVTLELGGANGFSSIPKDPDFYYGLDEVPLLEPASVRRGFFMMSISAVIYCIFSVLLSFRYPNYKHHKPFSLVNEFFSWALSFGRKALYSVTESGLRKRILSDLNGRYFVAPLQVFNDAQIAYHSGYSCVQDFIYAVIESFSANACPDDYLVFKHHPMDRGHRHYGGYIERVSNDFGVSGRVLYVHDMHLPSLLKGAKGAVLINSTVGLSAICHGVPVIALGNAVYNINGLTNGSPLDDFWRAPKAPCPVLTKKFKRYLIDKTQINGSFYGFIRLNDRGELSGCVCGCFYAGGWLSSHTSGER